MLYLTYYTGHNDGFGAQYQRILGIYSLCKKYNVQYYHTKLEDIEYQGLKALEKNANSNYFIEECNKRINIINKKIEFSNIIELISITEEVLLNQKEKAKNTDILVKIRYPYNITDHVQNIYLPCKNLYKTQINKNSKLTIGLHVRRGELYVVDSDRMLPNQYYIDNAIRVISICKRLNIEYIIELYTELPDSDIIVTGKHPGINNRISDSVIISKDKHKIHEFDVLPNLQKYINEELLVTFDRMVNCDILIASKSSLSTCASYLKKGMTIYHKFWHELNTNDIEHNCIMIDILLENYIKNHNNNADIPKKICQVWLQGNVPEYIKNNVMKLNPGYEYIFFNEKDCIEYLTNNFAKLVVAKYNEIVKLAHRCDLFRYCYLLKEGGIYIDIDLQFHTSFDNIIRLSDYADMITSEGVHVNDICGEINNGFIMTRPNNNIFIYLINNILNNINPTDYGYNVKYLYTQMQPTKIFQKFTQNNLNFYLFKEVMINDKYYITDKNNNILINTNGHDY